MQEGEGIRNEMKVVNKYCYALENGGNIVMQEGGTSEMI